MTLTKFLSKAQAPPAYDRNRHTPVTTCCPLAHHAPSRCLVPGCVPSSQQGPCVTVTDDAGAETQQHFQTTLPTQSAEDGQPQQQQRAVTLQVIDSIAKVPQEHWDALVASGGEVNPFLLWAFLHALEESGSAVPSRGWLPQHVVVRDAASGVLLGAVPLYLKGHSQGEYVFDSSWANVAQMQGIRYYPKLQSCVPFTPVTGPRLMVSGQLAPSVRASVISTLGRGLQQIAESMKVSSLHLTFTTAEEWAALAPLGFKQRLGIQFHWDNRGYANFDHFLADLKQSKRKSVRQERKSIQKQGLAVQRLTGRQLRAAHWDRFHSFYVDTVDRKWGEAYLTREFFHRIGETMPDQVMLIAACDAAPSAGSVGNTAASGDTQQQQEQQPMEASDMVAAALNLVGSHALFGRNWGCAWGYGDTKNLHFELCYYQALEEAIARQLPRVEAGAQGEHKLQRGYLPSFTYSCHYICDEDLGRAVDRFLDRERAQIEYTLQVMSLQSSPYKAATTMEAMISKVSAYRSLSSTSSMSADDGDNDS